MGSNASGGAAEDGSKRAAAPRRTGRAGSVLIALLGVVLMLAALAFVTGGIWLIRLGGSPYFLLCGLLVLAAALLVFARDALGIAAYAAAFLATAVWAVGEAGLDFWPLMSRLYAPAIFLCILAAVSPLLDRGRWRVARTPAFALAALVGLGIAAATVAAFQPHGAVQPPRQGTRAPVALPAGPTDWRHFANATDGRRFAALGQIDRSNVQKLAMAWTFATIPPGRPDPHIHGEDQNTPIQVGDSLFLCTPRNVVIAIDADTGRERWRFDPGVEVRTWRRCRSLGYHGPAAMLSAPAPAGEAPCTSRILVATMDTRLIALDARFGRPCSGFGSGGTVDLARDMGPANPELYNNTSGPLIAGDLVVVGSHVFDNLDRDAPGGVVRAYDARDGSLVWAFDPGNPAITRLPPAGGTYTRGTPNVWAPLSYDERNSLVFLPTGNAAVDAWGGTRTAADEAYTSAVVALDVRTGRERWKFQTVHHDVWNYDLPSQPILHDLPDGRGGIVPVLIQTTKTGQIFVLNRLTGTPVAEVREQAVPQGAAPGDRLSPTQPISVGMPQLGAEYLRESDMWGLTPFDQLYCRIAFRRLRYAGRFTPPGLARSLDFPGPYGGINWSSGAIDPANHLLIVSDVREAYHARLVPRRLAPPEQTGPHRRLQPMLGTPFAFRRGQFKSLLNLPCQEPPFGRLTAIDLRRGRIAWQIPAGTIRKSGPARLRADLPIPLGMQTGGGAIVTASGLVFHAGTRDQFLRAYDVATGEELWKAQLPVGAQATPITYRSPRSGRQYVVISVGGIRASPDRGGYVIAFALPRVRTHYPQRP